MEESLVGRYCLAKLDEIMLEADLARIDPTVPVRTRAADRFWGSSAEGALLQVLEELSQHLGHLEITRDVLAAPTSRL